MLIRYVTLCYHISLPTSLDIQQATVEGSRNNRYHKPVAGRLAVGYGGQFQLSGRPTIRLPGFDLHRRHGHRWIVLERVRATAMRATRNGVSLTTNYVSVTAVKPKQYRQLLSIDQVRRRITAPTWSRRGGRQLAPSIQQQQPHYR